MSISNLIARGIGFTPGKVGFIVTHGFTPAVVPADPGLRHLIARGVGFSPGSVAFMVRHGLYSGSAVDDPSGTRRQRQIKSLVRSRRRRR